MNKKKSKSMNIVCAAITAVFLVTASSCVVLVGHRVHGNGKIQTQSFSRSNFDSVSVSGDWRVDIRQSETFSVTIDTDENLFSYLDIYVDDGTLYIGFQRGYSIDRTHCRALITMPVLTKLTMTGSITGTISSFNMPGHTMSVAVAGSGDVVARNITVKNLKLKISGSGSFEATGKAQYLEGDISGSGDVKAVGLETQKADISISGSGSAKVWVIDFLAVHISGSGSIGYKGNPIIDRQISGSGRLYQL
ncbi:head GIN domain-containing protein [Treponema sp.]|uniref:head GIN domain-containing protein n=2 Tax=Treponema sp. TaxID=166 RepID=UPI003FA1E8D8